MGIPVGYIRTEVPGYRGMHKRVEIARGKASGYQCVDCDKAAAEWSCTVDGLYETNGKHYSLNVMDFEPRCRSCHRKFDGVSPSPQAHAAKRAVEKK